MVWSVTQPARNAAHPTTAISRSASDRLAVAAKRCVRFITGPRSRASIENEAIIAAIAALAVGLARNPVNSVEVAEQDACRIAGVGKSVVGPRQVLERHRARHIGRHQDRELGLVVEEVAALEQRAQ